VLLGGQLVARVRGAFVGALACGFELDPGTLGERLGAESQEQLVGSAQLRACVESAAFAAQPLAVQEMGAREVNAKPDAGQPVDRLSVEAVGGLAVG
jgi:hypothetical protein